MSDYAEHHRRAADQREQSAARTAREDIALNARQICFTCIAAGFPKAATLRLAALPVPAEVLADIMKQQNNKPRLVEKDVHAWMAERDGRLATGLPKLERRDALLGMGLSGEQVDQAMASQSRRGQSTQSR